MIGMKLYKNNSNDMERYFECAIACNEAGNLTIEDKGDFYEVVEIPPYIPTEEEIKKMLIDGVQSYMDTLAQTRGYDNIHTACSYINSTDVVFAREGRACLEWRDKVWRACYNILDSVMGGQREVPTLEELIEELPKLDWGDTE